MSYSKVDRKIQSNLGNHFLAPDVVNTLSNAGLARVVADALHREFGGTHAAIKLVGSLTQANERAVKNWFLGKNGPDGPHIVRLMRHSNEVLEAILILAGRKDLLTVKKLRDARVTLERMLTLLVALQD